MDKKELKKIVGDVRKQNSIFSDKSFLDNLSVPNSMMKSSMNNNWMMNNPQMMLQMNEMILDNP